MHEIQFSQINSPASSLLVYQNIPLVNESDSDIQFVHYSQILSHDEQFDNSSEDSVGNNETNSATLSHAELRHQIHIISERRRCAKINDAFEGLCKQLPNTYIGHKMSKVALLQKAASHLENSSRKEKMLLGVIKHLDQNCVYLGAELERCVHCVGL
ncbi:mlx-interacting protein [Gigaspora margarita]|uniref:Mlx-interacting protein n=1 Tax=Gigaspora margarita TaxID=4874 RepID=A0A8H3XFC4_GIGMA|nr:mlx-interacting protein [Gigaspora margarita]